MKAVSSLLSEFKRRNVLRAAVLYAGAVWALAQGVAQLTPVVGAPDWIARWFLIAVAVGFPFWIAFAWFYEFTPQGLKRESEIEADASITRSTGRRMDRAIIAVLALAVILLLTNTFVWHKDAGLTNGTAFANVSAKSVAVLPLVNESGDKDQQYFSDGLSEDLITALSQFTGLKVINRDSSFRFRDGNDSVQVIGGKLGVAHLLEGSVQKLGDEVRISVELVNAGDGSTLWSQHYDRPYQNLFALEDTITQSVAGALKARLLDTSNGAVAQSDRPPSGNLAAYNAYQQGQFYFQRGSESDLHQALSQFSDATRLDPRYAAAYAATAGAWTRVAGYFLDIADQPHAYAGARAAADTALRLDPDLAAAHLQKGTVILNADLNWSGARTEYQHALELAPGSADAYFSLSTSEAELGRPKSAVKLIKRALAGNPLNAFWHDWLASYLGALGRFDEAEAAARKSVELEPQQPLSYRELAYIEVLKGDAKAALAAAQNTPAGRNHDIAMAWALPMGFDHAAADTALQNLIATHAGDSSYQIAEVYALRRDPDNLFKWLDQAWTNRDNSIQYLLSDPLILRYKDDPRFAAFCRKVGLPTVTDAVAMK